MTSKTIPLFNGTFLKIRKKGERRQARQQVFWTFTITLLTKKNDIKFLSEIKLDWYTTNDTSLVPTFSNMGTTNNFNVRSFVFIIQLFILTLVLLY